MKTTTLVAVLIAFVQFTALSQESKANHNPKASVTNNAVTTEETPRSVKKEDGIQFSIHGGLFQTGPSHLPHGTLANFGLIDASGAFIPLEVTDHSFYNGIIKTKMFGNIILTSADPEAYAATETQIKKIHGFLLAQTKKATSPAK